MNQAKIDAIQVIDDNNIKGFFGPYRFLSNFHVCDISFEGIVYPSVENAYQAAKTLDYNERVKFIDMTPNESKNAGRKVTLRTDWEDIKLKIMCELNLTKYLTHFDLQSMLLNTDYKYLEETNWWGDTYWGVCKSIGDNHLGKTLMLIRDNLKVPVLDPIL